ncbi:putative cyclin-D6-1 [Cynara cardunculus var. scolymus]|uniref:Cyclin, C-terminal domain-containing protein n=1 Tax=Cynara cardunculus var. scolymus TaxID=59895 RepID=A0A118K0A9_CYNCS|nr:putative cyclin-D6-1 [Cynara cardunculus var. scolymus]KVI01037.1 Cyclin, C-terminal domain-containing protein [Cynara cardunculus var. scolymus]
MDFFFDLEIPLTSFKEHQSDILPSLFADESVFVLHDFPANFRQEALMVISKFSEDLDPFVTYLAVNYMDRFISAQKLVNQEKPWIVGLVAISCLSLSVKMKNSDLAIPDLQGYKCSIYDAKSISRMEVLILTSLKWRMRSITPFSFLYYFLSLFELEDPCLSQAIKDRASQIILKSSYGIKYLEFRPSVIAASALLHASQHLIPLQHSQFRAAISSCKYLNKESLEECLGVMRNMASNIKESTSVVDHQCRSSESENNTSMKRRRLNDRHIIPFSQFENC